MSRTEALLAQLLQLQAQSYEDALLASDRHAAPGMLARFGHQVFSQHGENGILAGMLRRVDLLPGIGAPVEAGP